MKKIILKRRAKDLKRGVTGEIVTIEDEQICVTLELPDLGNKKDVSCIPTGIYEGFKRISASNNQRLGGFVYELKNVLNRENIQIHIGNFLSNTNGCILVGRATNLRTLSQSTEAMRDLIKHIGDDNFLLEIRDV